MKSSGRDMTERPRVLLDPERVIVIARPPQAVGQITVNRQIMRVRVCPDCHVATTLAACPCCDGAAHTPGAGGSSKCPWCGLAGPGHICTNCGRSKSAPPLRRSTARALPPPVDEPPEEIPDAIDVDFKEG